MTPSRRVLRRVVWSALVLLFLGWTLRSATQAPRQANAVATRAQMPSVRSQAPMETGAPQADGARSAVAGEAASGAESAARAGDGECTLSLDFADPGGDALTVPSGTLRASWSGGTREFELRAAHTCVLALLPAAAVTIEVAADGLRHRPQTFELRAENPATEERVVLWPEAWIAVVVLDERGRAFTALAADRSVDPRRWFVQAFDVRARRAPPVPGDDGPDADPPSRFHEPHSYQAYELPGSAAGSLRRLDAGPHWVGLELFGALVEWQHLPADASEVTFTLDAGAIDLHLAALGLRVVDARGAALAGARVTLKADTSAHRRKDQMQVQSGPDGRVDFVGVVPGEYELLVESASALHQQRFWLATGERRELGNVALANGRPIALRVVDEEGRPAQAWIEVGPLQPGARAEDLYPPNLHRRTDGDGRFELQLPSAPSIVRATGVDPYRGGQSDHRSASFAVDPERPPAGEIVLVVAEPRALTFDVAGDLGARLEVLDGLGVIAADCERSESGFESVKLPPGDYEARLLDTDGVELARQAFALRAEALAVRLP